MFTTTKRCVDGRSVVLVYGPSSIGKTQLVGTLPDPSRVCIINADNGLKTLERHQTEITVYDLTKKQKRNPDKTLMVDKKGSPIHEELPREKRFPKIINFLKTHALTEDFKDAYDWLVFDDITEILNLLFEYLESLPELSSEEMALKLWKTYDKQGTAFIKALRDFAPYNIMLIGLEDIDKDPITGKRFIGLSAPGQKLPRRVPALVDQVFYYNTFKAKGSTNEVRKLVTDIHKTAVAKDRTGTLSKFEDPDMTKILNKMSGEKIG